MKKSWMMCLVVFMSIVFAGIALAGNETGDNPYFGESAGHAGGGTYNSSFGYHAGNSLTSGGNYNNFIGGWAGGFNTTSYYNNFIGGMAGYSNTTGDHNTFLGDYAGVNSTDLKGNTIEINNTLIGSETNIDYNQAASTINNATAIGYKSFVAKADSLVLGSIAGVNGATASVNVGIGTSVPARQLHVAGDQAVFRMDRPVDTAAFTLVRTDAGGYPLKTFVVGANASGSNSGSFVINDLGTEVSGPGTRRLTIDNNGNATFTNLVYAKSFVATSSIAYKTNVKTYENALETVKKLRGVKL